MIKLASSAPNALRRKGLAHLFAKFSAVTRTARQARRTGALRTRRAATTNR